MLEPGTQIGKYRIISKIGAGGMADVYEGEDTVMGRRVALKVLPPEFARDPERVVRFEKEVRHLASLDHPGIVTICDVGRENGCHFCLGFNFRNHIKSREGLTDRPPRD